VTGAGAADHFAAGLKRQGGASGSGEAEGGLGDSIQNSVEVLVAKVADVAATTSSEAGVRAIGHGTTSGVR